MDLVFSKLIGTLAVILVVAGFIGGSDIISKVMKTDRKWLYSIIFGFLGGLFGIYGNISGFDLQGAIISVRDMGPMLAGFAGGPVGGFVAGLIAGLHRLTFGGITAHACIIATCCIGLMCGFLSAKWNELVKKPHIALLLGALMEVFHLGVVLAIVKPFETAFDIVRQITLPFIVINAIGFALMVAIITYTEKQKALVIEKSRIQSELEVATVIQHSLLPAINEKYPGRSEIDISAFMETAKEVGGDFYDVFFIGSDRIAFMIGDVSGKGVPAALFMANAKITLQNCIRDIPKLSKAVETANNALYSVNEANMFVTLWVGILELNTGELTYVNAGHNPPILVKNGDPSYLRTKGGFVLAGMEDMIYKENSLILDKGDLLYLYTDGVTETNSASEELFGENRLIDCFENVKNASAEQIIQVVKRAVDGFVQDNDQFDDMTMLCFKYIGAIDEITAPATHGNK